MAELVKIEDTELSIREYNGQRVVTFRDIDEVHKRPKGTAKRNFTRNKKHFIEGVDYYKVNRKDVGTNFVLTYGFSDKAPEGLLFTESGYLMLVKSFKDDLAWNVQRELVNSYFKLKEISDEFRPKIENNNPEIQKDLLLKKQTDWYIENKWTIEYVCDLYDCSPREYMHHLLSQISKEYDFDDAREKYKVLTGNESPRNSDVISYFPRLREMASSILKFDKKKRENYIEE